MLVTSAQDCNTNLFPHIMAGGEKLKSCCLQYLPAISGAEARRWGSLPSLDLLLLVSLRLDSILGFCALSTLERKVTRLKMYKLFLPQVRGGREGEREHNACKILDSLTARNKGTHIKNVCQGNILHAFGANPESGPHKNEPSSPMPSPFLFCFLSFLCSS